VSTGITFSGFNQIDFNVILTSIMQQESQPLVNLQSRQTSLQSRITNFSTLSTRMSAMQTAATALSTASGISSYKATSNNSSAVGISTGPDAVPGRYDIVVKDLAKAQVTASESTAPDANTTPVATGGSITIGSKTISVSSSMTLKGLSDAINATADAPARASVVQSGANSYKLVLTAKSTGLANGFTVANNLTGGAGVAFTDTDADNISGDDAADNAVAALDADVLINNVVVKSASNTLESAIPGSTLTLYKKDPAETIVVDVTTDPAGLKTKLQTFVNAYNDLTKFMKDQDASAAKADQASIGRDPNVRQVRRDIRTMVGEKYDTGGPFKYLSQIGIEATITGQLQLKEEVFNEAVKNGTADVTTLLVGTTGTPGALVAIKNKLKEYTQSHGLLQNAQTQITAQITKLGVQIDKMADRLAIRRMALSQEFTAADVAMSRLKNQSGSLGGVSL
jgi:flagellar hook-associated protein 2